MIPIQNEHGEPIAYSGRAPDDAIPKYRFPKGFRKSLVLFNLHRARAIGARDVVVVEGFFDAFAVHQAAYPAVVSLMASTLSQIQAELLRTYFGRVLLMLDGDDGVHLRRIGGDLRGRCPLPTHTSRRSRDSFAVSLARNVWSCRSQSCMQARGGKPGGNILDLVALMESCSLREAALRLQGWSGTMLPRRPMPEKEPSNPAPNAPLTFTLQHIDQQR